MQSLIEKVKKVVEIERQLKVFSHTDEYWEIEPPKIVIFGCGGAGTTIITMLNEMEVPPIETIAIDTDKNHLEAVKANRKILLSESFFSDQAFGRSELAGSHNSEELQSIFDVFLKPNTMVFLIAGLGGVTGTRLLPILAQIADSFEQPVIPLAILPLNEKKEQNKRSDECVEFFLNHSMPLIVFEKNQLIKLAPPFIAEKTYIPLDFTIIRSLIALIDAIDGPSLMEINAANYQRILTTPGFGWVSLVETRHKEQIGKILEEVVSSHLTLRTPRCILVHITGGGDLTLAEIDRSITLICGHIKDAQDVLWGARILKNMDGRVRILIIAAGSKKEPKILRRIRKILAQLKFCLSEQ